MHTKIYLTLILSTLLVYASYAQTGIIKGRVSNSINNQAIPFANIVIEGTSQGTVSDIDGNYRIENLKPGSYNVLCSFIGYKQAVFYEVIVTPARPAILDIPLIQETETLSEVVVRASRFAPKEESPLSKRTISATEIYRNPGGNRDISKVIQVLPGVATSVSFRNDIIVRGGAPNENRFFLDGIEVPNINHFATQGSSGGPVGMINVNFIQKADLFTGAFPANRGNALSSIMDLQQIKGNDEKLTGTFMIGSSDVGLTLNGPSGKSSSFILSARRSYLKFLFKALKLPFLPTYNDFQYKHSFRIDDKNQIMIMGLAAIDDFTLNKEVNEGLNDQEELDRNNYILGNLPINSQWNYTMGAKWVHFADKSYQTFVVSRNHLDNSAIKYQDNIEDPDGLVLDYNSKEIENKLRVESTKRSMGWKWNIGTGFEHVQYTNSTYNSKERDGTVELINYDSKLNFNKFSLFTQVSRAFLDERLALSLGVRTDFSDYSSAMNNPLDQFSPRLSASLALTQKINANFNAGRYYQLPPYTVVGYRDMEGNLVNKNNGVTYIECDHLVGGIEYKPTPYAQITLEAFHKTYNNYPFLLVDKISLANLGSDFGVIGNDAVSSTSKGKSYGLELFIQQTLTSSIYGIVSYTYVRSKFQNASGDYIPSSWDNRHILNINAGIKLKRDVEAGIKFRLLGGAPYTPYDRELSAIKEIWDVTRQGIQDWDRLNTKRNPLSHSLDIRIDKRWYFKRWTLDAYIDIQNIYNYQIESQSYLDTERDSEGNPIEDPTNPKAYKTRLIDNSSGRILPSVGLMIEF